MDDDAAHGGEVTEHRAQHLAEEAFPGDEFSQTAVLLAFREAFVRGFDAAAGQLPAEEAAAAAFPVGEFTTPATVLAFRAAFIRGFETALGDASA